MPACGSVPVKLNEMLKKKFLELHITTCQTYEYISNVNANPMILIVNQ